MNKKLYAQLLLAMLVTNYVSADYFQAIGRSINNTNNKKLIVVPGKIAESDAKLLKRKLNKISKNINKLSAQKNEVVKNKIESLDELVAKNQVAKKEAKKRS